MSRCHQKWHWRVLLIKTQGRHKNLRMIASNIDKKQACLIILAQWFSSSRQVWRVWSLPGANIVNTSSAKAEPLVFLRKSKSRHCLSKTFPRHFNEASEDRITKRGYGTDANADFKTALGFKEHITAIHWGYVRIELQGEGLRWYAWNFCWGSFHILLCHVCTLCV